MNGLHDLLEKLKKLEEAAAAPTTFTPNYYHKTNFGTTTPLMMTDPGVFWHMASATNDEGGAVRGGGQTIQRWYGDTESRGVFSPASVDGKMINGKPGPEFPEGTTWKTDLASLAQTQSSIAATKASLNAPNKEYDAAVASLKNPFAGAKLPNTTGAPAVTGGTAPAPEAPAVTGGTANAGATPSISQGSAATVPAEITANLARVKQIIGAMKEGIKFKSRIGHALLESFDLKLNEDAAADLAELNQKWPQLVKWAQANPTSDVAKDIEGLRDTVTKWQASVQGSTIGKIATAPAQAAQPAAAPAVAAEPAAAPAVAAEPAAATVDTTDPLAPNNAASVGNGARIASGASSTGSAAVDDAVKSVVADPAAVAAARGKDVSAAGNNVPAGVDPLKYAAVNQTTGAMYKGDTIGPGSRDSGTDHRVADLQKRLGITPVTGVFGAAEKKAVMDIQQKAGLKPVDGKYGGDTKAALDKMSSTASAPAASAPAASAPAASAPAVAVAPDSAPKVDTNPGAGLEKNSKEAFGFLRKTITDPQEGESYWVNGVRYTYGQHGQRVGWQEDTPWFNANRTTKQRERTKYTGPENLAGKKAEPDDSAAKPEKKKKTYRGLDGKIHTYYDESINESGFANEELSRIISLVHYR